MRLGLYELIPDYRERCPLCAGVDCAVRHGLYFRQVVCAKGRWYKFFPVPRFLCRRQGPGNPVDVTFSVLPVCLAPRKRWSAPLMAWVAKQVLVLGLSICKAQSKLAALPSEVVVDEVAVHRVIGFFERCYNRLVSFPVPGFLVEPGVVLAREQAVEALRVVNMAGERDPPGDLVLAFQKKWSPNLLFASPLG